MRLLVAIAAFVLLASPARAEVVSVDETTFLVRHTAQVSAPPDRAWRALSRVGEWWPSDHTWSGDAGNLRLDPRVGRCFCETWSGGGVEHARVIRAEPRRLLRLRGELGPLQEMAAYGVLTFTIAEADGGATLTGTYLVSGAESADLDALAPIVDSVFGQQFARLARYAETGSPESR